MALYRNDVVKIRVQHLDTGAGYRYFDSNICKS